MYTSHGHHISGTIKDDNMYRPPVARCGGPGLCSPCSIEASAAINIINKTKGQLSMIETTKYVRKPFEVDAVMVTEENIEQVKDWCQGTIEEDTRRFVRVRVARVLNDRQTKAYPGDWVLYASAGYKVYTAKAFKKTFEPKDKVDWPRTNLESEGPEIKTNFTGVEGVKGEVTD